MQRWSAPSPGILKLNSDAAIFENLGTGLGILIHNSKGLVYMATTNLLQGCLSIEDAEAMALVYGMQLASDMGCRHLTIELILQLKSRSLNHSPFGVLAEDILSLRCRMFCRK